MIKKSILTFLFITFFLTFSSALPGISQKIPDADGQFVYYRDLSFQRESYIGILTYDSSTYAIRYYAPQTTDGQKAKDLTVYFTMDPLKKYVEMTGEKIVGENYMLESDTINYMHNIIYEFTSRRQKAGLIEKPIKLDNEYNEFGGNVQIIFNPYIPLFNIESINSINGKKIFYLITQGQLLNSQDETFINFKGLSETSKNPHTFKPSKSKTQTITQDKFSLEIDNLWNQVADTMWSLNDTAVIAINSIQLPNKDFFDSTIRTFMLGTDNSYPIYEKHLLKSETKKSLTTYNLTQVFHNTISLSNTIDIKYIYRYSDTQFFVFSLTVFEETYNENIKYFKKILNSAKFKN